MLPLFFLRSLLFGTIKARNFDVIHIGDPVLALVGWAIKKIYKKPIFMEIHGLDITHKSLIYQWYLRHFFSCADLYICISRHVEKLTTSKFPYAKTIMIPPGVNDEFFSQKYSKRDLETLLKSSLDNQMIIVTVGRLVKRKGVAWFIDNVMPLLPQNIIYIVAGDGPEKSEISRIIAKNNLNNRVRIVGAVTKKELQILYNTADIFIMPNINIEADIEGFGIVPLEAATCELPVIASATEGITDAVTDNQNGLLVKTENVDEFVNTIAEILNNPTKRIALGKNSRQFTLANFSWEKIATRYMSAFSETINKIKN